MRLKSEAKLKQLIGKGHARIRNSVQSSTPHMEPNSGNETPRPYEAKAFNTPVIITIHSYRHRLADPDGLCAKYHLDSIVKSGLLKDDSTKEIQEVRFKQTKIKKPEEERVVITLREVE